MKLRLILIPLFLFGMLFLKAQNGKYDIVLFGNEIGTGTTVVTNNSGKTSYTLETKAKATVMFKERTSYTKINMTYAGKVLESCNLKREKDGEWQDVKITYENGKHFYTENGVKKAVARPITFTSTQLFFKEPVGVSEIYVERLNIFTPIQKEEEGLYKTVIDGGDNYYRYENGVLVEFRLKKGVNIYMNRL